MLTYLWGKFCQPYTALREAPIINLQSLEEAGYTFQNYNSTNFLAELDHSKEFFAIFLDNDK